ncbi:MAG: hypothetical protein IT320_16455 [Anaerolineae bacterium]|nr:hypothetical protein [Anaerolineae bacterium]
MFFASSCGQISSTPSPIPSAAANSNDATATAAVQEDAPEWIETQVSDLEVGAWLPAHWQADTTNGLSMVEHMGSIHNGQPSHGITMYIFVPDISEMLPDVDESENLAYKVLERVAASPEHVHGIQINPPRTFIWGTRDAAYYLYTYGDPAHEQFHGVVLAVTHDHEVVVISVMAPSSEASRIRGAIPQILHGLSIDKQRLSEAFPEVLPDPLVFPDVVEQS